MSGAADPVIVMDTNVLHSVRLYLPYAEGRRRYPYNGVEWGVTRTYVERTVDEVGLRRALVAGGQVLQFMMNNKIELVRCAAVEVEFIRLDTLTKALRKAVSRSRVRDRWFNGFEGDQVNKWVDAQDRTSIVEALEKLFDELETLDIQVSDYGSTVASDVAALARGIMTVVYMDPMDSVVYASALDAGATHLMTRDGAFREVVNRLKNPGSSEAEKLCSEELAALVTHFTGREVGHGEFPVSQSIARLAP